MSLADKILEKVGTGADKQLLGAFSAIAPRIAKAQRFVFAPEVVKACHQLSQTRPSSLIDAQTMCRAPFKFVWMEWGGNATGRDLKEDGVEYVQEVAVPERFGCLLECLDDTHRRFGASFFWNFERGKGSSSAAASVQACPLGVIINWHDDWQPMERLSVLAGPIDLDKEIRPTWHAAKYLSDQRERDALLKMNRQIVSVVCPHMQRFVDEARKRVSFEVMEKFIQASTQDITGEVKILQTALCLLNSKNCVSVEVADIAAVNARRRKDKKKPLLSYSTVKIHLSRADQRAAMRDGASEEDIRQHIVRGHFKLRKSGVYWWRPFLRGNPKVGQVVRSGYEVAA